MNPRPITIESLRCPACGTPPDCDLSRLPGDFELAPGVEELDSQRSSAAQSWVCHRGHVLRTTLGSYAITTTLVASSARSSKQRKETTVGEDDTHDD